ncbi:hypothetical protein ACPCHT_13275 [Nucisporomicrobium flavum]|uniref:hypothetical protein n=1 Tax=Nucisporomicrobium flavum TaxID=2785915 RepID=UPI003C2B42BC
MPEDPKKENWQRDVDPSATFMQEQIDVSDLEDYKKWVHEDPPGWRKIKASVYGGAALGNDDARALAKSLVDPQSLADASGAFQLAYQTLSWLENMLRDHSHAIAGKDKAWQGPAADAFLAKMDWFAEFLGNQAEHIAGADGTNGTQSVPNQLWNSARYLAWAQDAINHIDVAWAQIASADGAPTGSNGVAISKTRFAKPMTEQMAQVVDQLATQYQMTYSAVTPPTGTGDPKITVAPIPSNPFNLTSITPPNLTTLKPPPLPTPPGNNLTPPGNNLTPPGNNLTPPGNNLTPPGNNLTPPGNNLTPPGNNLTPPGVDGPPGLENPNGGPQDVKPPSVDGPPDMSALGDGPENLTAPEVEGPPGLDGPGSGNGNFDVPQVDGPPGTGTGTGTGPGFIPPVVPQGPGASGVSDRDRPGAGLGDVNPPSVPKAPGLDDLPGAGGVGGGGPGAGGIGDVDPPTIPSAPGASDAFGPGVNAPGTGGGMPFMPGGGPAGGGMGGGSGGGIPERPDASGLLGGDENDWTPGTGAVDVPDAPGGANPGGAGLGGIPPMPGMPGGGPAGGGAGGGLPERPDASGLVGGEPSDWESPGSGVDIPDAPSGAVPGGAGLGGIPPMPGMPGGGPAGGGAGGGLPERPDASGLVDGQPSDWESPGTGVDIPDAPSGAVPGGTGLGGIPPMPGMPGGGPAGGGAGGGLPERPDASGLVDGDPTEWQPGEAGGVPDAPSGAVPGGAGLGGIPPMPGMPGGGPANGGSGLPERPDASGLVDGDPAEWQPGDPSGVPDAPGGSAPGGMGLAGGPPAPVESPADGTPAPVEGPADPGTLAPGVPMMPGFPGGAGGAGPREKEAERPDSAGLVDGDPQEWETGAAGDEPGAPQGAAPGGAGLGVVPPPPVDPATGWHEGVTVPGVGIPPVLTGVPEPEEREQAERPEAAELLAEEEPAWAGEQRGEPVEPGAPADDRVPVLRADDGNGDRSAWDDTGQSWWLHGDGPEREERLTDA